MSTTNNKKATNKYPILDVLKNRWSPRAFDAERPVSQEDLQSILEAARWAMSSYNEQPWRYLIATKDNTEDYEKLLGCLVEFNQLWATTAPVIMLGCVKKYFQDDMEKKNKHAYHDLGAASAMLTIEATSRGIYVHQMAGIDYDKAQEAYDLPEGYEVVTALALGYQGDIDQLPEDLQKGETAERSRKSHDELFFGGAWDKAFHEGDEYDD